MTEMDPELRRQLLASLARRAERLAKMARLTNTPSAVLSLFARHVQSMSCALLGFDHFEQSMGDLFHLVQEHHGVCRFCDQRPFVRQLGMCQGCWDALDQEERDVVFDALDPRKGPKH